MKTKEDFLAWLNRQDLAPCPTPRNNSSLCRPVCQEKNGLSIKGPLRTLDLHGG